MIPSVQIDYGLLDHRGLLDSYRTGYADQEHRNEQGLLGAVGNQFAAGDYAGAAGTAMQGGKLDVGMDIRNWDQNRQLQAIEFLSKAAKEAGTPQRWKVYVDLAAKAFGPDMTKGFESFDMRDQSIAELEKARQAVEMRKQLGQEAGLTGPNLTRFSLLNDYDLPKSGTGYDFMNVNGAVVRTNPATGEAEVIPGIGGGHGDAPSGYRWRSDGSLEAIPGGPAIDAPKIPSGYRLKQDSADELEPIPGGPEDPKGKPVDFETVQKLRKERTQLATDFRTVSEGYGRVQAGAGSKTGAGDIAVVYGFMKLLDPTSVVREGEFATAENTSGVPAQVVAWYNRVLSGARLPEETRQQFVEMAGTLFEQKQKEMSALDARFGDIAKAFNIDPSQIIMPLGIDVGAGGSPAPDTTGWNIRRVR